MSVWNNLPNDLLSKIGNSLNIYKDYVRFRAVCPQWRSGLPNWPKHSYYQIPWLLLPSDDHEENDNHRLRGFYNPLSLNNYEIYYLDDFFESRLHLKLCRGSFNGWLVIVENGLTLKLFNPLTKSQFQLPPISSFPDVKEFNGTEYLFTRSNGSTYTSNQAHVHISYIDKIMLSDNGDSGSSFIAVAIHGTFSKLAFTRLGDDKWTAIPSSLKVFHDCLFFDGKFHAVNHHGDLVVYNINSLTETETEIELVTNIQLTRPTLNPGSKLYLVKSEDKELLMVERYYKVEGIEIEGTRRANYKTIGFNLFKLDSKEKMSRWVKIQSLGSNTIFLGLNTSTYISSKYCPMLKQNHIYYTDDRTELHVQGVVGGHDFGSFNVANRSFQRRLCKSDTNNLFVWPHPIWVVLNPC